MNSNEFFKIAKKYIVYGFVLPKEKDVLYTKPSFVWSSSYTLQYGVSSNITFDEQEMVFQNLRKTETYVVIEYDEIKKFKIMPVMRNLGIYQHHLIEVSMKTDTLDFQIESREHQDILSLCRYVHQHHIEIEDPCDVLKILLFTQKSESGYAEYMIEHFSEIMKKHRLESRRIRVTRT